MLLWAVWVLAFAWGEVIPVNDGLGWDGYRFAGMVERGPAMLPAREINSYYVQRVGPSLAVRGLLEVSGTAIDNRSIRLGFTALNLTLLSVALLLLMNVASRLNFTAEGRWILFLGLFLTPANGRLPIYYAPIGDSTAFFIGALLVWGYVARSLVATVIAFLIALVSWPAAFLFLPLLIWPRPQEPVPESRLLNEPLTPPIRNAVVFWALPLGWILIGVLTSVVKMPPVEVWTVPLRIAVGTNALVLGCAAGFALALAVLNRERVFVKPSLPGIIATAVLVGAGILYVRTFESGSLAFGGDTFAREAILFVRSRAFASLAGHAAYYSGLAVVAMAFWSGALRQGLKLGTGAFLATALTGLIALDAESRRLNAYWPLAGVVVVMAAQETWLTRPRALILGASMVLLSKLWWPMVGPDLLAAAHDPGNYFNTQGPSMSTEAVVVNGLIGVALIAWITLAARRGSPRSA